MTPVHDLNLNLLSALAVLLDEGNLRRAAAKRGVTQSAMSHALRQLRVTFDDPLLVRSGNTMVLTPRAEAMRAPLRRALAELERAIAVEPSFVPEASDRRFRILASDAVAVTLVPALSKWCAQAAPRVRLDIGPANLDAAPRLLESGEADLLITPVPPDQPGLRVRGLYRSAFAVLCRQRHPQVRGVLDLDTFCALPHVVVGIGDASGLVDRALERLGRSRRVALTLPYFLAAPIVVEHTDHLLTLPDGPARYFARTAKLQCLRPPVKLPSARVNVVWHDRYEHEPGLRWLRAGVLEAARSVGPAAS